MSYDDERVVELDDDLPPLLENPRDDIPVATWSQRESSNDERLLEERPPHWD